MYTIPQLDDHQHQNHDHDHQHQNHHHDHQHQYHHHDHHDNPQIPSVVTPRGEWADQHEGGSD